MFGAPEVWRNGPFRLNPTPYLSRMAAEGHNPVLPLSHVTSTPEVRAEVHETLADYQEMQEMAAGLPQPQGDERGLLSEP